MPYLSFICDTSCPVIRQLRESVFEEMPRCPHADLTKTTLNLKEEKAVRKPPKFPSVGSIGNHKANNQALYSYSQCAVNQKDRALVERITGSADQRNRGTTADQHAISEGDVDQSR